MNKDRSASSLNHSICLLLAWSKIFDKLVTNRLVCHTRCQGFLHRSQFGWTLGVGTENALHELQTTVEGCHNRGNDCCLADIKGAFSNQWWSSIFDALGRMGCLRNLFRLVKSFLYERKILYQTENSSVVHEYNVCIPQGSKSGLFSGTWSQIHSLSWIWGGSWSW